MTRSMIIIIIIINNEYDMVKFITWMLKIIMIIIIRIMIIQKVRMNEKNDKPC